MQTAAKTTALALIAPTQLQLPQFPTEAEKNALRLLNSVRASILDDDWPKKIAAFRRLYSLTRHDRDVPGFLLEPRMQLHGHMFREECSETADALTAGNFPEFVDGVLDIIYVLLGWLAECGLSAMQINQLMEEVHASNLTKVGPDGKPILDPGGKVLKGDDYVKADIAGLLRSFGWTPPTDEAAGQPVENTL